MTAKQYWTIWCDGVLSTGDQCPVWIDVDFIYTVGDYRRLLRRKGWSSTPDIADVARRRTRDYCPSCTKERDNG